LLPLRDFPFAFRYGEAEVLTIAGSSPGYSSFSSLSEGIYSLLSSHLRSVGGLPRYRRRCQS
jgi:hypothetical protein